MKRQPPSEAEVGEIRVVPRTRVPLSVRMRAWLFSWLVMLAVFGVVLLASGAYRSTRGLVTITVAFVVVSIASAALFWLIGQFEPAIAPLVVRKRDARGHPVAAREFKIDDLALNDGERFMLAMHYNSRRPLLSRPLARLLIVAVLVAAWLTWMNIGPGLVGRGPHLWGGLAVMIPAVLLINRAKRRSSLAQLSESLLAAGRCAACGYDLKYLQPAADTCTVCAECGAAWRIGVWRVGANDDATGE